MAALASGCKLILLFMDVVNVMVSTRFNNYDLANGHHNPHFVVHFVSVFDY